MKPWGEWRYVRDSHNEMRLAVVQKGYLVYCQCPQGSSEQATRHGDGNRSPTSGAVVASVRGKMCTAARRVIETSSKIGAFFGSSRETPILICRIVDSYFAT
jgi:hypothetical protein